MSNPPSPRTQRTWNIILWVLLVVFVVGTVAFEFYPRRDKADPVHASITDGREGVDGVTTDLPADYVMPAFSLVDQNERPFASPALAGKVWIADFVFTRCKGPCPLMTQKMKVLQDRVADSRVKLLTFSADPDYDRPAVLKQYAKEFGADESRWVFATGGWKDMAAVAKGLRLPLINEGGDGLITHGTKLVLVGPEGRIRGYYSIDSDAAMERLASDAGALAKTIR